MYQSPLLCLDSLHLAPEQQQLARPHRAGTTGQQPRRSAVGREPPIDERLPEPRVRRGEREIRRQSDLHPDSCDPTAHDGHHRYLHRAHQGYETVRPVRYAALDAADTRTRCVRRVAGHDVGARAEVLTPRREHGDPDALVLFGAHEGVRQRADHVIGQGVAALRAIEGHAQHDSVEHDVDAVGAAIVRHRRHLTSSILNVFRR